MLNTYNLSNLPKDLLIQILLKRIPKAEDIDWNNMDYKNCNDIIQLAEKKKENLTNERLNEIRKSLHYYINQLDYKFEKIEIAQVVPGSLIFLHFTFIDFSINLRCFKIKTIKISCDISTDNDNDFDTYHRCSIEIFEKVKEINLIDYIFNNCNFIFQYEKIIRL